jgi:hypothetical protein
VKEFLEKVQILAIDVPMSQEQQKKTTDPHLIFFFNKITPVKQLAISKTLDYI